MFKKIMDKYFGPEAVERIIKEHAQENERNSNTILVITSHPDETRRFFQIDYGHIFYDRIDKIFYVDDYPSTEAAHEAALNFAEGVRWGIIFSKRTADKYNTVVAEMTSVIVREPWTEQTTRFRGAA